MRVGETLHDWTKMKTNVKKIIMSRKILHAFCHCDGGWKGEKISMLVMSEEWKLSLVLSLACSYLVDLVAVGQLAEQHPHLCQCPDSQL